MNPAVEVDITASAGWRNSPEGWIVNKESWYSSHAFTKQVGQLKKKQTLLPDTNPKCVVVTLVNGM